MLTVLGRRLDARIGLALLCIVYLATVLPAVADQPLIGGDEGWIISASARLAEDGVFGSRLFSGFYGSEDHYYFNLPLQHLLLAGVFKVFGVGILQARLLSVAAGLALLVLTFLLGKRFGGYGGGLLAAALLVLLRLNLTPFSGLTLTDLGATVRYDLISVPFALTGVLVLSTPAAEWRPRRLFLAGLLVGLAGMTQFIGGMVALPLLLHILGLVLPRKRRAWLAALFLAGVLLPLLPYGAYVLPNRDDFRGQARAVEQETRFLSPDFYLDQLRQEPDRYALATGLQDGVDSASDVVSRPSARLVIFLIGPLALIYVLCQAQRGGEKHRLLALLLVCVLLELALFESTKRFVYWVIAVPFVCVALSDFGLAVWRGAARAGLPQAAARSAAVMVALLFLAEGLAAAAVDVRDAAKSTSYEASLARIDAVLPSGASALGDNRLWPGLRQRDFRSLHLLFYHTNPRISRERATDIEGAMQRIAPDYVLISPLSRSILAGLSIKDAADFWRYIDTRGRLVATVPDSVYGPTEVYELRR